MSDISPQSRAGAPARYDAMTIALHWATAALVLLQFALAETWGFFPHPAHHLMIVLHMSFGLVLAGVILLRILWRPLGGRHLPPTGQGWTDHAAKALHYLLYVLVCAEVMLGFATRWTDNRPLSFFGLLIPSPFGSFPRATGDLVVHIHDYVAWTIITLAGIHALAALTHHYLLRDDVLRRMLPGRGRLKNPAPN